MFIITLPNSKLSVRMVPMKIASFYESTILRHCIFPDIKISPTIQDRINNNNPEMYWVLNHIK